MRTIGVHWESAGGLLGVCWGSFKGPLGRGLFGIGWRSIGNSGSALGVA